MLFEASSATVEFPISDFLAVYVIGDYRHIF